MSGILNVLAGGGAGGPTTFATTTVAASTQTNSKTGATTDWVAAGNFLEDVSASTLGIWPATTASTIAYATWANAATSATLTAAFGTAPTAGQYFVPQLKDASGGSPGVGVAARTTVSSYTGGATTIAISPATTLNATATFTASYTASATTINITAVATGTILPGMVVINGGVAYCKISTQVSGTVGGAGTYNCIAAGTGFASSACTEGIMVQCLSPQGSMTPSVPSFNGAEIYAIWSRATQATSGLVSDYYLYVSGNQPAGYLQGIKIGSTQLVGTIAAPVVYGYGTLFQFTLTTPAATLLTAAASVTVS